MTIQTRLSSVLIPVLLSVPTASFAQSASSRLGVSPSEGGGSASCIFSANGGVVFAPPGADCGKVAVAAEAPSEEEFRPAESSRSGAWIPAESGVEKLFVHIVERRETTGSSDETRRVLRGTRHEVFTPGPADANSNGLVDMRVTTRLAGPGRPEQLQTEMHSVKPTRSAYLIQSSVIEWQGGRKNVAYSAPVKLLPDNLAKGATWQVARGTFDEVTLDQKGEVLGFQDVNTPSGPFEGCLVVRYRTTLAGRGLVDGVPQEVSDSAIVRTVWFARGVGMVLAKEEMKETVEVFGLPTAIHLRTQSGLKGVKRVATAPASAPTE